MSLKDRMATDMRKVFLNADEFADEIIYKGVTMLGVFEYGPGPSMEVSSDSVENQGRLWVSRQDVPSPAYRDSVMFGGVEWLVLNIESGDGPDVGGFWELALVRDCAPRM